MRRLCVLLGCLLGYLWAEVPGRFVMEGEVLDLTQNDPAGDLEGNGLMHCAPVAAANVLWPRYGEGEVEKFELVKTLASVGYMNTHLKDGTHLNPFMRGMKRYVEEQVEGKCVVAFQGMHRHEREFSAGLKRPELDWIRRRLSEGAAVWLMAGWYRLDEEKKEYERIGYHWVTLVGYGEDASGEADEEVFIVHDSAPGAGWRGRRQYVRLERLEEGVITKLLDGYELKAEGFYRLGGGMHLKRGADVALLDGVVAMGVEGGEK